LLNIDASDRFNLNETKKRGCVFIKTELFFLIDFEPKSENETEFDIRMER